VISLAVKAHHDDEQDRVAHAIVQFCEEDSTLLASYDQATGDFIVSGMGELHLEILLERLRAERGIEVETSTPRIAYKETILHVASGHARYKKQSGGRGHFGDIQLRVEPRARGKGIQFENAASADEVPPQFVRSVEQGVREALDQGVLAGYPVTDVRVILTGGKYHPIDSTAIAFTIAGSIAVKDALRKGGLVLLEPIMRVGILIGEVYLGVVLSDMVSRRGLPQGIEEIGTSKSIEALVPLFTMLGYATTLRTLTEGRGTFTAEFSHYDYVPANLAEEIADTNSVQSQSVK